MIKYYIRINGNNRIIKIFSDIFERAEENDILIGEGDGVHFRASKEVLSEELQQYADVENGLQLVNEYGLYSLKYENGLITKILENELQDELNQLPKTQPSKLETLEQENIMLMETSVELYELSLKQDKQITDLKQENVEMMLALTELYENVL